MKNWLVKGLIFLLLFGVYASAEWQFMLSPKQEKLPQFCLVGYSWDVEPFVIALSVGASAEAEAMIWQRNDYIDTSEEHYFDSLSAVLAPAVNLRIEKLDYKKKTVPFLQVRYVRDFFRTGEAELDLPWVPGFDDEGTDLEGVDARLIWEFLRVGGGVRLKVSESLSLLADYGLEASLLRKDVLCYDNNALGYEERIRRLWPNSYGGVSLVWHW
ncbi:MAG: hypothetical protein PHD88_02720 [Firmicutes bacterium]|nr:hypothetical protein [Bacillota bacterium]MDD4263061.1 hypothetical protein [Bacillota bacterium]MDD4693305.1 hypothetical protein [Bacillota bacterium]